MDDEISLRVASDTANESASIASANAPMTRTSPTKAVGDEGDVVTENPDDVTAEGVDVADADDADRTDGMRRR